MEVRKEGERESKKEAYKSAKTQKI
jgi:hypothetical protein